MTDFQVGGKVRELSLELLDLDHDNPRLPVSFRDGRASQDELALYIDKHHEPVRIAESISKHGFFVSEPLIVLSDGSGRFTVLEGNRRLVALRGLALQELRVKLQGQTSAWRGLSEIPADAMIPVVEVENRESVDSILGFRHISGIEPWDPFAQARFVADLVERLGDLEAVAERVGRSLTEIRSIYRDHDILVQAREEFELDTSRAESAFGVFKAAMGIVKLRGYINAPAPREVNPAEWPLPDDSAEPLANLLGFVYGTEHVDPVISDSRQLKDLAEVLADPSGAGEASLLETRDLSAAKDATVDHESGAHRELTKASRSIRTATNHVLANGFDHSGLRPEVEACREDLGRLEEIL